MSTVRPGEIFGEDDMITAKSMEIPEQEWCMIARPMETPEEEKCVITARPMETPEEEKCVITVKSMESPEEMDGKGYVHWKSWQETYAGLAAEEYLSRWTLERCQENARRWPDNTLVAKDGERVIGFVCCGKNGELSDCGEVYALYVLREYQGRQVGYRLMRAAMEQIREYPKVSLWVLRGNEKAIRFYERYGFRFDGTSAEIMMGKPCVKLRMIMLNEQKSQK